jgi:hypothetical protein
MPLAAMLLALSAVPGVAAEDEDPTFLGMDLKGSMKDERLTHYVPPVTNFIYNETPFITTEVRPLFVYHRLSDDFITNGGHAEVIALQARVAITENLGFIATKDGYTWLNFDDGLDDTDGFNNIAAGLKYNFFKHPESQTLLTAGARYEVPINDLSTNGIELAGDGDGWVNPFLTGATTFGKLGLQGSFGANFALDTDKDNSFMVYSLHADYEVQKNFFPLVEMNGFTAFNNADRSKGALKDLDGADVLNFGSEDRGTTITLAGGMRYRFTDNFLVGVAVEQKVSGDNDSVFGTRVTMDAVLHF